MHMMDADRQSLFCVILYDTFFIDNAELKQKVKELENKIKEINSEKNAQERMYD